MRRFWDVDEVFEDAKAVSEAVLLTPLVLVMLLPFLPFLLLGLLFRAVSWPWRRSR